MPYQFRSLREARIAIEHLRDAIEIERELMYQRDCCFFYCSADIKKQKMLALERLMQEIDGYGAGLTASRYEFLIRDQKRITPKMFAGIFHSRTKAVCEGLHEFLKVNERGPDYFIARR
jgi:hypothetical protein